MASIFLGSLIKVGIFGGIQNNLKICGSSCVSWPHSSLNKAQPNLFCDCPGWDFLGVKFWSRDFFGFWFLPPSDHTCHLKSIVPAWDRHLIITDSLLCPWGKKALTFSLNWTLSTRTPCYYMFFLRYPLCVHINGVWLCYKKIYIIVNVTSCTNSLKSHSIHFVPSMVQNL